MTLYRKLVFVKSFQDMWGNCIEHSSLSFKFFITTHMPYDSRILRHKFIAIYYKDLIMKIIAFTQEYILGGFFSVNKKEFYLIHV